MKNAATCIINIPPFLLTIDKESCSVVYYIQYTNCTLLKLNILEQGMWNFKTVLNMEIFLGIFLDNLLRIKVIWFVKRKIKRRALRIFLEECYQNCIILSVLWPPQPTVFFCRKTFLYRHNAMQGQANNNASFLSTSYTPELNSSLTIFLSFLCIKIESLDILHKR